MRSLIFRRRAARFEEQRLGQASRYQRAHARPMREKKLLGLPLVTRPTHGTLLLDIEKWAVSYDAVIRFGRSALGKLHCGIRRLDQSRLWAVSPIVLIQVKAWKARVGVNDLGYSEIRL